MGNWFDWQEHVNEKLDELLHWKAQREADITMENLRLQRLLNAALQRIGELESPDPSPSGKDMSDTVKDTVGPTASS